MTRRSRFSTPGLITRHLGSGVVGSLLVALLIAAAVLAVALAPRALVRLGTAELRHDLTGQSPALLDFTGTGRLGLVEGLPGSATVDDLVGSSDRAIHDVPEALPLPLRSHVGPAQWVVNTPGGDGTLPNDLPVNTVLTLSVDLDWTDRITFAEGVAPQPWTGSEFPDPFSPEGPVVEQPPIEVALSRAAAEELQVGVGDIIGFAPADVLITGIYDLSDPDDAYWVHESGLARPTIDQEPGQLTKVRISAYVDPLTLGSLQSAFSSGKLSAFLEVDPTGFDYAEAATIQTQARQAMAAQVALPFFGTLSFRTGLADVVNRVVTRVTSASALLALSVSGLLGVLLAVFALGVQSVLARRRPALALAAARGAGSIQLRTATVLEGLLLSLPGSAVAVGIAMLLLPGDIGIEGWVLPALVALAPPVLFGVLTSPRQLRSPRGDLQVRSRNRSRWIAEVAVVGLAAVSLFLLARRGLVASSEAVGIDPLLSATPLLLSAAVCIGVLRFYPAPLVGVQRMLRRRRGSAGVLGAARAIRDPALGFVAALALVVGISVVVFSTVMATTMRAALVQAARDTVGADIQIDAKSLSPQVVDQVRAVDGVQQVVTLSTVAGVEITADSETTQTFVIFADTAALHEVRPDIPALTDKVDGRIPLVISSDWSDKISGANLTLGSRDMYSAGVVSVTAIPQATRHFVLVDSAFAAEVGQSAADPEIALVRIDADRSPAELAPDIEQVVVAAQPEAYVGLVVVTDSETLLSETRSSPTVASLDSALLLAALASLVLTMLTVVLASVGAATARNRLVGVLRILGMSPRQLRAVQAWELGPVAITAVVVGTVLGIALAYLVTNALDLRPFVGGRLQPGPAIDPLWIAAAVGAFVLVVVLAGIVAAALGRRFAPAGTLKMGEG